jgi:hypothetical protein
MNDLDLFRILFLGEPVADEPEGPISEISRSVDQQPAPLSGEIAAKLDRGRELVRQRSPILARQGTVVASWRTRHGRKVGPYYRLAWRERGRQKSLYLGCSAELAQAVRHMLAELQRPLREDRALRAEIQRAWAAFRAHKVVWARELARFGLYLHGSEIRGWRNTTLFDEWPLPQDRKNAPDVDQRPVVACPLPASFRTRNLDRLDLQVAEVNRSAGVFALQADGPSGADRPWAC